MVFSDFVYCCTFCWKNCQTGAVVELDIFLNEHCIYILRGAVPPSYFPLAIVRDVRMVRVSSGPVVFLGDYMLWGLFICK